MGILFGNYTAQGIGLVMREIRAVYVEDDEGEGQKYSRLLSTKKLRVKPVMAPSVLSNEPILKENPDLVLIDYELTQKQRSGNMATYRGGTLATSIREERSSIPLILVTRRALLEKYSGAPGQLEPFDISIFKDEIRSNRARIAGQLVALASGYLALKKAAPLTWTRIMVMLRASRPDIELLKQCRPDSELPKARATGKVKWAIPTVVRWILDPLFRYPGILYDQMYAATALGISCDSLSKTELQRVLSRAEYQGVFSDLGKRWWRSELLAEAFRVVKKAGMEAPLARSFAPALWKVHRIKAERAVCLQSGETYADTVCFVLRKPVMYRYTLAYFPDDRPKVMDQARVSFKARGSSDFDRDFLSLESRKAR